MSRESERGRAGMRAELAMAVRGTRRHGGGAGLLSTAHRLFRRVGNAGGSRPWDRPLIRP